MPIRIYFAFDAAAAAAAGPAPIQPHITVSQMTEQAASRLWYIFVSTSLTYISMVRHFRHYFASLSYFIFFWYDVE